MKTCVLALLMLLLVPVAGCVDARSVTLVEPVDASPPRFRDYAKMQRHQPMSAIQFCLPDSQVGPFLARMAKTLPTGLSWSLIQQITRTIDDMAPGDTRSFRFAAKWQGEDVMMDFIVVIEPQSTILYFFGPRAMVAEVHEPLRQEFLQQMTFSLSHM